MNPGRATLYTVEVLLVATLMGVACSRGAVEYDSTGALAAALVRADVDCASPQGQTEGSLVQEQASCSSDGRELGLYVFAGSEQRDNWLRVGARLGPVAVGPNWAVTGDPESTARIASELHAALESGP